MNMSKYIVAIRIDSILYERNRDLVPYYSK